MQAIELIIHFYAKYKCPTLCKIVEYHIQAPKSGKNYVEFENKTSLWVYHASPKIKIEQEYTVMGVNAIISATGGSLGLFLGLSCYGVAWKILEKIETVFIWLLCAQRKKKGKSRKDMRFLIDTESEK